MKKIYIITAVLVAVFMFCSAAFATLVWQKEFNNLYKPKADSELQKAKCLTCHTKPNGKEGQNAYGKQLEKKKIEAASLKAIEKLDADKDGHTNIVEIKAGTLPGNPKSKPK